MEAAAPPRLATAAVTSELLRKWGIALAVSLGALLEVIDTSIVNVALPDLQTSFGATLSDASWVITSYVVANVIILTLAAWLGRRFGKRRYFIFSLIAFTASSAACGLATSLELLIAFRIVQGLCGGGLLTKAQSILFQTFTKKEDQAMAQGVFGTIVIAGPAIGPTLGGWLTTHVGWRWIFFVNLPVGIAAVFLCLTFLPADPPTQNKERIDWWAVALLVIGLGSLQIVLEEGQMKDWLESPLIRGGLFCAAVGLSLFVARVLGSPRPVVDLKVLRYRQLWAGCILSTLVGLVLYGTLFAVPVFAQTALHLSAQETGMILVPGAVVSLFAMPATARLLARFDARTLVLAGMALLVQALLMLSRLSPQMGDGDLFWPLIVRAVGVALVFLPLNMAALGSIPPADVPAAAGLFSLTRQLGASTGVAMLATVLVQRQAFHRGVLVENLGHGAAETLQRLDLVTAGMMGRAGDLVEARDRALTLLDRQVDLQAAVMSFGDTFWFTLFAFGLTIPLVFLLGKAGGRRKVSR